MASAAPKRSRSKLENLAAASAQAATCHFYRTSGGAEVDLLLAWPDGSLWAIEVKRSLAPRVERGFHAACEDLAPARKFVVYPGRDRGNQLVVASIRKGARQAR